MTPAEVLDKFWNKAPPSFLPIQPQVIAERAGIEVSMDNREGYSGSYERKGADNGRPLIRYDGAESFVRQRFTIAHELGHHFLGHGDSFRDTFESDSWGDPKEIAANRFAAELLMPAWKIRELFIAPSATLSRLAQEFGVSEKAMGYRLRNLGLIP